MTESCVLYVDGFNFYYAIKRAPNLPIHPGWCDFVALARQSLVPEEATLERVKYFTTPVEKLGEKGGPEGSEAARQEAWLSALRTVPEIEVVYGTFTGDSPRARKEKETDVNIAVQMVVDAAKERFDRALLITADRDLLPAIRAVVDDFGKSVDVWLPPGNEPVAYKLLAAYPRTRVKTITTRMLERARLVDRWQEDKRECETPKIWRLPTR